MNSCYKTRYPGKNVEKVLEMLSMGKNDNVYEQWKENLELNIKNEGSNDLAG